MILRGDVSAQAAAAKRRTGVRTRRCERSAAAAGSGGRNRDAAQRPGRRAGRLHGAEPDDPDGDEFPHAARSTCSTRAARTQRRAQSRRRAARRSRSRTSSRSRSCAPRTNSPVITYSFRRDENGAPQRVEPGIHLGLAVDSERKDGSRFLVVPVIKNADALDFAEFRAAYEELVAKARDNKLAADDLQGATFTLTNPGGIGTVASVPRLMAGQGAIFAAGAIGYPPGFARANEQSLQAARRLEDHDDDEHLRSSRHSRRAVGRISAAHRRAAARRRRFLRSVFAALGSARRPNRRRRSPPPMRGRPFAGSRRREAVGRDAARGRRRHGDRLGVPPPRPSRRASRSARRGAARRPVARSADLQSDAGDDERDSGQRCCA